MLIEQTIVKPAARAAAAPIDSQDIWDEVVASVREEYASDVQDYPWIIGFSGGKDSTVVAQAVFEALLQVPPSRRKRHVHIVSNDTLVESPLVMAHLAKVQAALRLDWQKTMAGQAKVREVIADTLDSGLPDAYDRKLFESKNSALFQHVYERYQRAA